MKLRELYRSPRYYSVCESDRTERLVLHVVAGGIAMYSVVVELTPEEEGRFRSEGHLDSLALDVARNESRYADRTLKPRDGEQLDLSDGG
jgi:hypothetical protein